MTFATYSLALVENAKFVPLLLSLRDYGIKEVQMIWHAYIKSYLACNGYCFMLYRILWPYKINILCAWYSLQMTYKSPHNSWSWALARSVKWPFDTNCSLWGLSGIYQWECWFAPFSSFKRKKERRNPGCLPSWQGPNLCSDLLRKSFLVDSDYWLAVRIFQLHESSIIGLI
jgi:hypothetical protein